MTTEQQGGIAPEFQHILDELPRDIRESIVTYGLTYPPLIERILRSGDVSNTPHPSTCACGICRFVRHFMPKSIEQLEIERLRGYVDPYANAERANGSLKKLQKN